MEYDFSDQAASFLKSFAKRFSHSKYDDQDKKDYDHEMTISEQSMQELHENGVTYITESGDGETMVIKVSYSGNKT